MGVAPSLGGHSLGDSSAPTSVFPLQGCLPTRATRTVPAGVDSCCTYICLPGSSRQICAECEALGPVHVALPAQRVSLSTTSV